jgi:hypothetical protein
MTAAFPYTRLGPRTPHLLGHDSLWLSEDHLLAVRNRRFVEEYQRFELGEIQAIVIRKQARLVIPVYWAVISVALLITAIVGKVRGNAVLTNGAWAFLALLGVWWLVTSLFKSCSCQLQTAVGAYSLPGLYRMPAAQRVLKTLEARISEVQGALPEDWTVDDSVDVTSRLVDETPSASATRTATIVAVLACLMLFIDALSSWYVRASSVSRAFHTLNVFITLVAVVLPVIAIVFTRGDRLFRPLRILFMVAVFAVGFANYGTTVVTVLVTAFQAARQQPPLRIGDFFYWVNQIAEVSLGTLGLLQILSIAQGRHPSAPWLP